MTETILFASLCAILALSVRRKAKRRTRALKLALVLAIVAIVIQFGGSGTESEITAYTACVYGSGILLFSYVMKSLNPIRWIFK